MTVQEVLDELEATKKELYPGEIEDAVKEKMPGYEVEAFDDDQDLQDSFNTASVITTFIQNEAENKTLLDIDLGNIICDDEYAQHSYTVVAVKTKEVK